MTDPTSHIDATTRTVGTVEREGKPAKVVTATRTYPTSVEDLWDAVTDADRLGRWFAPVSGDFELGGSFQIEGNASGRITACDPPNSYSITWEMQGDTSWVTVTLSGEAGGAEADLRIEHTAHVPEEFWDTYGPGEVGIGWEQALLGLALHSATGESHTGPGEVEAWQLSEFGVAFSTMSSERWVEASIADGTDPDAARAAGERVTAFYTIAPEEGSGTTS